MRGVRCVDRGAGGRRSRVHGVELVALAAFPLQAGVVWDVDDETTTVYYMDEDSVAQADLTEKTSTGRGGFYDATAGTRVIDFGGAATNCTPGIAWPGTEANQIRVPVRAGHIGYGSMTCDEPQELTTTRLRSCNPLCGAF